MPKEIQKMAIAVLIVREGFEIGFASTDREGKYRRLP